MSQPASRYQRLSVQDAGFLYLEHAGLPQHVAILAVVEGGPLHDPDGRLRLDEVRRELGGRLELVPRLRQRVLCPRVGQGLPLWVDDPAFDLANHVRAVHLPAPGGQRELLRLCDQLCLQLLNRTRPLWELWLVTGLAQGRVGLVLKLHHTLADGLAAVQIAGLLLDSTAEAPAPPRRRRSRGRPRQGRRCWLTTCAGAAPGWQRRWPDWAIPASWPPRRVPLPVPGGWPRVADATGRARCCAGRWVAAGGWPWSGHRWP